VHAAREGGGGSKVYVPYIERKDNRRFDVDDGNGEVCFR